MIAIVVAMRCSLSRALRVHVPQAAGDLQKEEGSAFQRFLLHVLS
jgi:hypothetical protein